MRRVVVAGHFDPLHIGHLNHFQRARALGDYLTVVINPDEDILRKRGLVFMSLGQRMALIRGLQCVDDVVVAIDTDGTVARTLRWLRPAIFAKGGDRRGVSDMPEREVLACKEIDCQIVYGVGETLESSTSLLQRVQNFRGKMTHNATGGKA